MHYIKHVRGGTWTICHKTYGPIYGGFIERNAALRICKVLEAAEIDYTAPDAAKRIIEAVSNSYLD